MMQAYYQVLFLLSALLSGIYMFLWRKHYDVHMTMVFTLIPIVNLGYVLFGAAKNTEAALNALKIVYLGGCFLSLMVLLTICSLCRLRIPKWLRIAFMALSTVVYLSVLTIGRQPWFYTDAVLEQRGNGFFLVRHYGFMHTVFYIMVILHYALCVAAIIYCLIRKRQVSRKILLMLFVPLCICIGCYFFGRHLTPEIELAPAGFVIAQIFYILIAYRLSLYNVADTAAENMVQSGDTAFISFDKHFNYLGSNATARRILPELENLTVDLSMRRSKTMRDLFTPWLETYRKNPDNAETNRHFYKTDDKIYLFTVIPITAGSRRRGYEIVGTDDTLDRAYIDLLKDFKQKLETDVNEKTRRIQEINKDLMQSLDKIVEMHNNLILSMATMVESRDNSTGGHIRRTSKGVEILIEAIRETGAFDVNDSFCINLIKAAPMHDLGKIAVDDAILRKPGRFEPWEFEKMKEHAAQGARIVHEILQATDDDEFHVLAENVAHYHHERWDGSGYPDHLKGEEIPLEARIMAVADVYDALVSKRVYKDKMSFEKADSIIMEGMGSQFDPAMEAVYVRARPKLEAYYSELDRQEQEKEARKKETEERLAREKELRQKEEEERLALEKELRETAQLRS